MLLRTRSDHRNNSRNAQLSALLDRPLHTIKLKNRHCNSNDGTRFLRHTLSELKLHAFGINTDYASAPDFPARRDLEFLSHLCAQNLRQVSRMISCEKCPVS